MVGARPAKNVRRECPPPAMWSSCWAAAPGRDGIGGATGSSKAHKLKPRDLRRARCRRATRPIERKLQRLFRDGESPASSSAATTSARAACPSPSASWPTACIIDLDKVPKKYDGLDGTELAISESQERMAVVLAPEDVDEFIAGAQRGKPRGYRRGGTVTEEKPA